MSTIKSSAENLTLNADGANNDIKFQSNGSEVASIDQAGTVTATTFTGAATDATKLPLAGGTMTGKLVINGTNTASVTNAATLAASQVLSVNSNSGEGSDNVMIGAMSDGTGDQFIEATNSGGGASYKLHLNPINNGTVVLGGGLAVGGTGAANTLNDYEEGTFTPSISSSNSRNGTWSSAIGRYIKIGNMVTLFIDIAGSGMYFTSERGWQNIANLPFSATQPSGSQNYAGSWSGNAGAYSMGGSVYLNSTSMYLHAANTNWNTSGVSGIGVCISYLT